MGFFRRIRDAVICVVLLALPFFFLNANLKDPARTNAVDRVILRASAPVQFVATELAQAVSTLIESYVFLVDVSRENDELRRQVDRLRAENRALREQARENRRLKELLQLRQRMGGDMVSARVIGKEVSPFFRVLRIRIDRGERDRVRPGMPVVSAQGLVGQVRRAWGRYADVQLTVDRTSAVAVVVQRTGAPAILRGTGESDRYLCRTDYLDRDAEVQVGDEIYTSGLGQSFPASLLVGTVTAVRQREFGLYQEAEVTPAVDFSTLDEVVVLTEGSRAWDVVGEDGERPALPSLRGTLPEGGGGG